MHEKAKPFARRGRKTTDLEVKDLRKPGCQRLWRQPGFFFMYEKEFDKKRGSKKNSLTVTLVLKLFIFTILNLRVIDSHVVREHNMF